ncbi:unnamed protein product [Cylicostephanus goldi]|uniref:Uncharacterized protein n=1 Tax=Cylicostephanus goldi TaxID=71465 RepID=A0A3P6QDX2_CYLGO|nr:unnamed protein product [Cylicostephanus goldi]
MFYQASCMLIFSPKISIQHALGYCTTIHSSNRGRKEHLRTGFL